MNNIDMLYRIFYTVFSMSCMALVLLPAVLVSRTVKEVPACVVGDSVFPGGMSGGNEQPGMYLRGVEQTVSYASSFPWTDDHSGPGTSDRMAVCI